MQDTKIEVDYRKPVQIALTSFSSSEDHGPDWTLVALCDDGSLWQLELDTDGIQAGWYRLPKVPGT